MKERYFLMGYFFETEERANGWGSTTVTSIGFPNKDELIGTVTKTNPEFKNIAIISIYEFKKKDYEVYIRKDEQK